MFPFEIRTDLYIHENDLREQKKKTNGMWEREGETAGRMRREGEKGGILCAVDGV